MPLNYPAGYTIEAHQEDETRRAVEAYREQIEQDRKDYAMIAQLEEALPALIRLLGDESMMSVEIRDPFYKHNLGKRDEDLKLYAEKLLEAVEKMPLEYEAIDLKEIL